jgi:hypothetical protein
MKQGVDPQHIRLRGRLRVLEGGCEAVCEGVSIQNHAWPLSSFVVLTSSRPKIQSLVTAPVRDSPKTSTQDTGGEMDDAPLRYGSMNTIHANSLSVRRSFIAAAKLRRDLLSFSSIDLVHTDKLVLTWR